MGIACLDWEAGRVEVRRYPGIPPSGRCARMAVASSPARTPGTLVRPGFSFRPGSCRAAVSVEQ